MDDHHAGHIRVFDAHQRERVLFRFDGNNGSVAKISFDKTTALVAVSYVQVRRNVC
jgi:hypothetical protein